MNKFKPVLHFPGVWTRSIPIIHDNRGFFYEELRKDDLPTSTPEFVQDSMSYSKCDVLRGMHLQIDQWQLVTLLEGEIIDVLLNLESNSNNYAEFISFNLCWNKLNQVLVSPGIAHGFAVISESARIHYKSSVYYGSTNQIGVRWNSKEISHLWPQKDWLISPRDKAFPLLSEYPNHYVN
jgi:dTDP-4-dehydrorhamnose 3,5-epimerase